MCAAKFERTGFAFRNIWPSVKQQSTTFAHEQSGTFIRKNSGKSESVSGASLRSAAASQAPHTALPHSQPEKVYQGRGNALRQHRARFGHGPRHVASDFLRAQAGFQQAKSFSSVAVPVQEHSLDPLAAAFPRDDRSRSGSGVSIDELMQVASEKYKLNADFWGKYADIPSMAQATDKEDILQIIENFVLIHRKHVYLFQRLKNTVMKNLPLWSAPDLAELCHAWAQLGFLHEDLCVAMSDRVTSTSYTCTAQELCWLMDAYATARCSVRSVTEEITAQTLASLDDFNLRQLCLHASSFARLNIHHEELFRSIAIRIVQRSEDQVFSARDLTLAAYSFAKLGFFFPEVFEAIAVSAQEVIRDFTARDLQMLIVAFARAQHHNSDLLLAVSLQAQRRIAQFSAEALTLMLRSLAFFDVRDSGLFTRAIAQLPRVILTFRPADVTTLLSACAVVQVHSESLFDVITPFILEKAPMFTPFDWLSALRSYSSLGYRDSMFLDAMMLHLEAARLSLPQLSAAMRDCSRLSFVGHSKILAQAVSDKLDAEAFSTSSYPAELVAQMYAALLLLGHSSVQPSQQLGDSNVSGLLKILAQQLSSHGTSESLSTATKVSLCYAILLAPPMRNGGSHPFEIAAMRDSCMAEASTLALEERTLLRQIIHASELMPWNRCTHASTDGEALLAESNNLKAETKGYLLPYSQAASIHLTPLASPIAISDGETSTGNDALQCRRQPSWQGIFVAHEIQRGLQEISQALASVNIESQLVSDCDTEPHILLPERAVRLDVSTSAAGGGRDIALIWGSSVHYMSGFDDEAEPTLSPSAKFQVALLQALKEVEVVVVPYWWWQNIDGTEGSGHRLATLLATGASPKPARLTFTRQKPERCIE